MSTLEDDLNRERRHLAEIRQRAERRLGECRAEADALLAQGRVAASDGDTTGAAGFERRVQKLRARAQHYEALITECATGGDRVAREVLLARLEGPETDLLTGEADRNRLALIQRATQLLRARDQRKSQRQRWVELNDKIRGLRKASGLPPGSGAAIDFRVAITPATYTQKPDGPTYRAVSDLVHHLGL